MSDQFEPKIVGFLCKWCTSAGADLAGTSRLKYPPNVIPVTMFCSSRLDPQAVLQAFEAGADAVLIGGCHPGDCHYQEGNYKALRRFRLLQQVVAAMGIEPERFRLEWISASEADQLRRVMDEMSSELRELGPLHIKALEAEREEVTVA